MSRPLVVLMIASRREVTMPLASVMAHHPSAWCLIHADDMAQALVSLAARPVDVVISDAPQAHLESDLAREILLRYPWIMHVSLCDPALVQALRSTRWSERILPRGCPPDRLLAEIHAAYARRSLDSTPVVARAPTSGVSPVALVVEDVPEEIELVRQAFSQVATDLECYAVSSAPDALAFLARTGGFAHVPTPHVILLDIHLPVMNGYEFLARYRSLDLPSVPVVVFSCSQRPGEAEDAIRHGAAAFVPKPTTWDRYLELAGNLERFARLTAESPVPQRQLVRPVR